MVAIIVQQLHLKIFNENAQLMQLATRLMRVARLNQDNKPVGHKNQNSMLKDAIALRGCEAAEFGEFLCATYRFGFNLSLVCF